MVAFAIKSPQTPIDWTAYYELRWRMLRAPWQQPRGSERDELESTAFHIMAVLDSQEVIGVGRIHHVTQHEAQIRYMAVSEQYQHQGIGHAILLALEQQARVWRISNIILNAREHAVSFYAHAGYRIVADAPTLFGSIKHSRMQKILE